MTIRRILATSGGFIPGPVQQTVRPGAMLLDALAVTGASRPRVCLVLTASGDADAYYAMLYESFNAVGCDVTQLRLFPQPTAPPEERLVGCDLVWVGGGSVANLLSLWRLHGVDQAMRAAWEAGVVLAGVSAGSLCWHVGGTTDSFGPTLRAIDTGLALVPYANGVHYDSEPQRPGWRGYASARLRHGRPRRRLVPQRRFRTSRRRPAGRSQHGARGLPRRADCRGCHRDAPRHRVRLRASRQVRQ